MTPEQYNKLNSSLSLYSQISAALEGAEAEIKTVQLAAAQALLPQHAELKVKLANIEADLRKQSDAHYDELFSDNNKRTHATPFGAVKYTKSTSLEFEDEEKVCLKIERVCEEEEARAAHDKRIPLFTGSALLRKTVSPNLEALEALPDVLLALLGVARVHKDNFKVVPFAMKTDKPAKKKAAA